MNQRTLSRLNRVPARRADYNSGVACPTRTQGVEDGLDSKFRVSPGRLCDRRRAGLIAVSVAIATALVGLLHLQGYVRAWRGFLKCSRGSAPVAAAPAAAPEEELTATEAATETAASSGSE